MTSQDVWRGVEFVMLAWVIHRLGVVIAYLKTNEARTDALLKAITGSKFPE